MSRQRLLTFLTLFLGFAVLLGWGRVVLENRSQDTAVALSPKDSAFRASLKDRETAKARQSLERRDIQPDPENGQGRLGFGEAPRSLSGTDIDGKLVVDENGHFVPTRDALYLFNYFLTATGEEPLPIIFDRVLHEIESRLPPEAALEATAFFENYLAYRESARELHAQGDIQWDDYEKSIQAINELRQNAFGIELADSLFGAEDEAARIGLEQHWISTDTELSETERMEAIAELEAQLPESTREARERAHAPLEARYEVEDLRASGASEEEVYDARSRRFGDAAADRLTAVDEERAIWNDRLDTYREDRDAILADTSLDEAELGERIDDLRTAHFSENEIGRVRGLDESEAKEIQVSEADPL